MQPPAKSSKPILSHCSKCNHIYDFRKIGYSFTPVDNDIEEAGIICPNCQTWFHSFFTNKDLEATAKVIHEGKSNRKIRRAFDSQFRRFNKQTRRRLGYKQVEGKWVKPGVEDAI